MTSIPKLRNSRIRLKIRHHINVTSPLDTNPPIQYTLARHEHPEIDLEIKKSHFLARAARTDDDAAARAFINQIRSAYPDARHHCNAYIIAPPDTNLSERSSDDGEPSGTAGAPMLEVLRASGLVNLTVVVTRYFGGTLLGTGGLVRAYSEATNLALEQATKIALELRKLWTIQLPATVAGRVEAELRSHKFQVEQAIWDADVHLTVSTPAADPQSELSLQELIASLTQGTCAPVFTGEQVIEVPLFTNSNNA